MELREYVNRLACIRVKGSESKCFMIESGVRQGSIMSPWLFTVYMGAVIKEVKMGMGQIRVCFLDKNRVETACPCVCK